MPECYIRGSTIKYLRIPDEVIDMVKEDTQAKSRNRTDMKTGRSGGSGAGGAGGGQNQRGRQGNRNAFANRGPAQGRASSQGNRPLAQNTNKKK